MMGKGMMGKGMMGKGMDGNPMQQMMMQKMRMMQQMGGMDMDDDMGRKRPFQGGDMPENKLQKMQQSMMKAKEASAGMGGSMQKNLARLRETMQKNKEEDKFTR